MQSLILPSVSVALFIIASASETGALQGPAVWWGDGMVKLRQANSGTLGDPIPADADFCSATGCARGGVSLSAARNEFEAFQIFIAAPPSSPPPQCRSGHRSSDRCVGTCDSSGRRGQA